MLRRTSLETILDDIAKHRSSYIDVLVQENLIGSRFKSEGRIIRKYSYIDDIKKFIDLVSQLNCIA